MNSLKKFMKQFEQILNSDIELLERNKSYYSTIEGKTAVVIDVNNHLPLSVEIKSGKFRVTDKVKKDKPLLHWKTNEKIFKDAMLGNHKLLFSLLDPEGELLFDTNNFTHWNGATVIEILLLAHEMTVNNPEITKIVNQMGADNDK